MLVFQYKMMTFVLNVMVFDVFFNCMGNVGSCKGVVGLEHQHYVISIGFFDHGCWQVHFIVTKNDGITLVELSEMVSTTIYLKTKNKVNVCYLWNYGKCLDLCFCFFCKTLYLFNVEDYIYWHISCPNWCLVEPCPINPGHILMYPLPPRFPWCHLKSWKHQVIGAYKDVYKYLHYCVSTKYVSTHPAPSLSPDLEFV